MADTLDFVATCPKGIEGLLVEELRSHGTLEVRETRAAVTFSGSLETAYRACLWSRLASRVLLPLGSFSAATADELYSGTHEIPWEDHLSPALTIAVDATGSTEGITHTGYAARKVKDAIVDRLRERSGSRPSVDVADPDVRLNLRLHRDRGVLSVDLSGDPLHMRGYRLPGSQSAAPLKENLAAAILLRAGWPRIASEGGPLVDPMCGSGTLLVEGAMMVTDRAPGLLRSKWGFRCWPGHEQATWDTLVEEADERAEKGHPLLPAVVGSDIDSSSVDLARTSSKRAGFGARIAIEVLDVSRARRPAGTAEGVVVTNPPHGLRLQGQGDLEGLYRRLGDRLLEEFSGWRAAIFTAEPDLGRATGLRASKSYSLFSGSVPAKLYLFEVSPQSVWRKRD